MPENLQKTSSSTNANEAEDKHLLDPIIKKVAHYWREIAIAAVVLIGAGTLFLISRSVQEKADIKAWDDNFTAVFDTEELGDEKLAERLEAARKKNPESTAIFYACMLEVSTYFEQGKYDKALASANLFIQKFPTHFFARQMRLESAKILMAQGKLSEAKAKAESVLDNKATYLEPEAKLMIAQIWMREAELEKDQTAAQAKLEKAREKFLNVRELGVASKWMWETSAGSTGYFSPAGYSYIAVKDKLENPAGKQFEMPAWEKKQLEEEKKQKLEEKKKAEKKAQDAKEKEQQDKKSIDKKTEAAKEAVKKIPPTENKTTNKKPVEK